MRSSLLPKLPVSFQAKCLPPLLSSRLARTQIARAILRRASSAILPGTLRCDVEAEPPERYQPGGYHLVHLGDVLKGGRYKILHKLGWGGYATVWLARDYRESRYVALKVMISKVLTTSQEVDILEHLRDGPLEPGKEHIVRLLDSFEHEGPNGTHQCLALELLGPSVQVKADRSKDNRLSSKISWEASRQTVQAVTYVHATGIVHGDTPSYQSDADIFKHLGEPDTGLITAIHGYPLTNHIPSYLVRPASLPFVTRNPQGCLVKLVDFGEAFYEDEPRQVRCPLVFRAPEAVLLSHYGTPLDIWSLGCSIFELVVGHPPFGSIMPSRDGLIHEWVSMFGSLPTEWAKEMPVRRRPDDFQFEAHSLREWLQTTYFEDWKRTEFSRESIETLASLLESVFKYRPCERPAASELLDHPWFLREHDKRNTGC